MHPWLVAGAAFLLGISIATLGWEWRARIRARRAFESGLSQQAEHHGAQQRLLQERLDIRARELTSLQSRLALLEEQGQAASGELVRKTAELAEHQANQAALKARFEEAQKSFEEKEALLRESSETLKKEFELLANKIFERQGEAHQERLATVLSPFKDQIVDFRKRVEEVYHTDTKDRASLLSEVRNLQQASERINEEAENLARALKGDVKVQGNWGEIVLERVLEESGLRSGHEYFLQAARRSESGDLKRPDVLIRLPDGKDVIVDAKVSLVAYEQALSAESEAQRDAALKQHLTSIRGHIKRLSEQDYDRLTDVRSLDFVLLFVPVEAAFTLAMQHDERLFTEAFDKRIVIVSPTTLMMTLRIINNVWRFEKQNRNAQEIAKRAGALYDKLRVLMEDMDQLGKQLGTAERTFQSAYGKLASGRGNLVRQVEQFRQLGAQVKKPLDKKLLEEASEDHGEP